MYNTHTNIRTKQKPKIKHSPRNLQLKAKMKREKSNHKYSILLEDFMKKKKINSKNKYDKSKVSRIKNYFRNIQIYKIKNSDLKDISTYSTKKMVKSTNNSKNKNRKNNINSFSKNNKTKSYHSISNKQLKIHQLFNKNKNKKNIIININKCYNKRNNSNNSCNSYNKTNNKKQESYISRMYNNKKFNKDSRNNTINIESIVFIGDINDPSSFINRITIAEAEQLIEDGIIGGGMLPKLTNCTQAVRGGVHRVHILDGRIPHSMLLEFFTDKGVGTMFHLTSDTDMN